MAYNTPSSLICFTNGYSYVNIPIALTSDQPISEDTNIRECQVGPLPNFTVHGTVSLVPHNPETVKIFSMSRAGKKTLDPVPLKVPTYKNEDENKFSYETFLIENIGTAVCLTCSIKTTTYHDIKDTNSFTGIIKAIYKDSSGESFVVLQPLKRQGLNHEGEQLIKCSSVTFLKTVVDAGMY